MAIRRLPDPAFLRKVLDYNPATGAFIWKHRTPDLFSGANQRPEHTCAWWNTKNAGNAATRPHGQRHLCITVDGKLFLAHRVAWAIHFGLSDFGMIDHINGNGADNRIANLRLCTTEINTQNCRRRHDNKSGATGVNWHVGRYGKPRWVARIQCGNRRIFLGSFDSLEDAVAARKSASEAFNFGPVHGAEKNA